MLAVLVVSCLLAVSSAGHMEVVYSWRNVDFAFPSQEARNAMIKSGDFKPHNIVTLDVDVWEGGGSPQKVFVTMPRLKPGTPATVTPTGALEPYPDWNWHREGNCEGITSVFRIDVDECGRLWVLDTGKVDICSPQILVFNLFNDTLIGRYVFPKDVVDSRSILVTIAVDTRGPKCVDTFAYVADVTGYLIVFDANKERFWRANNKYFYPYPLQGSFAIDGVEFDLMDGVLGLALGPLVGNDRQLYYHSLASVRESWVATSLLRNKTLFTDGDGSPRSFHVSQYTRSSQSAAEAMSPSGILFFGLVSENSIACWNSRLPYTRDNIITVAQNNDTLQFASGLKYRKGNIWVLTSRFQNFIVNNVSDSEVNYRVLRGADRELTAGTSCSKHLK